MKKIALLAFVLLSLCVASLPELQMAHASPYRSIDVATAYDMITNGSYPDLVALDVRTKSEYDGGHIYGAVWIPHTELEARIGELANHEDHEIVVYCGSGVRSVIASEILDVYNFTKVYNMLGGISEWKSAGYPVWNATVHNVNTTFNYDTIQAAIDAPQTLDEHTILVDAGTYYEHVTIDKSISLIGENKSTTVIDGNGTGNVIDITANHVNVTGFTIRNGANGIFIKFSDYNIISGNIVTDNQNGIRLYSDCTCDPANESTVRNNIIKNNEVGIYLEISIGNKIYHNNFINNTLLQVYTYNSLNFWDDDYPSGGNYWDDYEQPDENVDGIGDTFYVIDVYNWDRYPLVVPLGPIPIVWNGTIYPVEIKSNSTISRFQVNTAQKMISFNVTGKVGTLGFCNLTLPNSLVQDLWQENFTVLVDGKEPITMNNWTDGTYTHIYFTYPHSTHKVVIIPEFPTWTSMLLMLITLTVAIAIYKRRLLKTPIH